MTRIGGVDQLPWTQAECLVFGVPLLMYVTRHSHVVDLDLQDSLWNLYVRAYLPEAELTATHEMLDRLEFNDQLSLHSNRAWVVWDDGVPVAMTLIATDVRATRWLSELYFAKHYPERFRHGLVHYVVWAVVDPEYVAKGAVIHLGKHALAVEASEGALLVFDTPESNQPEATGGAAELMVRLARMVSRAELIPITTQRYYAIDFVGPLASAVDSSPAQEAINESTMLTH